MNRATVSVFDFVMIKPSHYDDDGYPIVWMRSLIPSNTLAALNGLALDCKRREILGSGVRINLHTYDETNRRIRPDQIVRMIRKNGGRALIGFVGVQSNQFPRAVDLAKPFLKAGLPVMMGGFHVSGCLSMLKEIPPEIQEAMDMGISMFAGECEEGRLDQVLVDAWKHQLKPVYNYLDALPRMDGTPTPVLPADAVARNLGNWSSFDLGRGCPYQCSFCTIINVQGRKSRFRTPDDLEHILRENAAQGIDSFFVTDDNLARNKDWEAFFDRMIHLREVEGMRIRLVIQVDTLCHKIPNFIEKAARAGVNRVFIGLENINPDNLTSVKKRQNKITDYRQMLQEWHKWDVYTWCGYIIGFPADTKESILRDIEIIKRELPVDVLQLNILTPLPGSEDHKTMLEAGIWMDPDLNKYNLQHVVTQHPKMSYREWDEAYWAVWDSFFSQEHIERVAKRHAKHPKGRPEKAVRYLTEFKALIELERLHPQEGGMVRLKHRRDRRPGFPIEHPLVFYPRFWGDTARKVVSYVGRYLQGKRLIKKVANAPDRFTYTDQAMKPVNAEEMDSLELYTGTFGGSAEVEKKRRQDEIFASAGAGRRREIAVPSAG